MRKYIDATKTCDHCGCKGLEWREINKRWRLVDLTGRPGLSFVHNCTEYKEYLRVLDEKSSTQNR